jgi:hypothetical protein
MSVTMMCERALGLLNGPDLQDLESEHRTLLENLNYDGLLAAYAPREALACARHFAGVRDGLLTAHPWVFARKSAAPAQLAGNPPPGWKYAFSLPTDCLKVLAAIAQDGRLSVFRHWEVAGRTLTANESPLRLAYTARITDTDLWDGLFAEAFCSLLAGALGTTIAGDPRVLSMMEQRAAGLVAAARANGVIAEAAQPPFEMPGYLDYSGIKSRPLDGEWA